MRIGLRAQIVILLLLVLALLAFLTGTVLLRMSRGTLTAQWQHRWQDMAFRTIRILAKVPDNDRQSRVIHHPFGNHQPLYAAHLTGQYPALGQAIDDYRKSPAPKSPIRWVTDRGIRFIVARVDPDGRRILVLETSDRQLRKALRSNQLLSWIVIGLALLFALLFGTLLFYRVLAKPVDRMLASISQLSVGVMESPVSLDLRSDLLSLNESIAQMVSALLQKQEKIQKHLKHLKEVNLELAQMQQSLIQSEKLASVGQLAAGIAHEIGNPLSIILGYLELLRGHPTNVEEKEDFLERISNETTRIDGIIQNLLSYSRPTHIAQDPTSCDPIETIQACIGLIRPQKRFRPIAFEVDLPSDLPTIHFSPGKLQQVLVNLVFNAADALAEDQTEKPVIRISARVVDAMLELVVADNGPGINPDHIRRVFDPFFTTKEPGSGTGLGLSISYQIIRTFGGDISIDSEPGRGARFTLSLPIEPANPVGV